MEVKWQVTLVKIQVFLSDSGDLKPKLRYEENLSHTLSKKNYKPKNLKTHQKDSPPLVRT